MEEAVCCVISLLGLIVVFAPFFLTPALELTASLPLSDPELIARKKVLLLEHYLASERQFKAGALSKTEWEKREDFLTNQYLDLMKRFDHLKAMAGRS